MPAMLNISPKDNTASTDINVIRDNIYNKDINDTHDINANTKHRRKATTTNLAKKIIS